MQQNSQALPKKPIILQAESSWVIFIKPTEWTEPLLNDSNWFKTVSNGYN